MTLQSSGTISMNDLNVELAQGSGHNASLNDTNIRTLLGKPSGTISLADAYGKSNSSVSVGADSLLIATPSGQSSSTAFGERNGILKTADGGYVAWTFTYSSTSGGYGYFLAQGLTSSLGGSGQLRYYPGTAIYSVWSADAAPMVVNTADYIVAWISINTSNVQTLNIGRASRTTNGTAMSYTSLNNSFVTSTYYDGGIAVACNSADAVLVAYSIASSSTTKSAYYQIRTATLGVTKAATSLTSSSYCGTNSVILGACAYGTDFFVFYYSTTYSTYGVLKINAAGTTVTRYTLATSTGSTPVESYSSGAPAVNGSVATLPIGSASGYGLLTFDMSSTASNCGVMYSNLLVNLSDGVGICYLPTTGGFFTSTGRFFSTWNSSLSKLVTLDTTESTYYYSSSAVYFNATGQTAISIYSRSIGGLGLCTFSI